LKENLLESNKVIYSFMESESFDKKQIFELCQACIPSISQLIGVNEYWKKKKKIIRINQTKKQFFIKFNYLF
jgi:hypothetical protein